MLKICTEVLYFFFLLLPPLSISALPALDMLKYHQEKLLWSRRSSSLRLFLGWSSGQMWRGRFSADVGSKGGVNTNK